MMDGKDQRTKHLFFRKERVGLGVSSRIYKAKKRADLASTLKHNQQPIVKVLIILNSFLIFFQKVNNFFKRCRIIHRQVS